MIKKVLVLLFLSILILNLVQTAKAVEMSPEDKAYHDKLVKVGLSNYTITSVMTRYPTQDDLRTEIKKQLANNEIAIEIDGGTLLISEKLKNEFTGIITNWWSKTNILDPIYDSISSVFKSVFGTSLTDAFKWFAGVKKSGLSRLSDLITGLTTAILIWILYYFETLRYRKLESRNYDDSEMYDSFTYFQEREDIRKKNKWLTKLIGKSERHRFPEVSYLKIVIFTLIYFGLFQLPIINRILETITFYHFMPGDFWANIFLRTLFSAMIIGFLPHISEKLIKMRKAQKKMNDELEEEALAQKMEDMAKT